MEFGPATIVITILSILLAVVLVFGLIWIIPIFIQRQKANIKRKIIQKKTNEEMVRNIRYRSPSTVGCNQIVPKAQDYGSTQSRQMDPTTELLTRNSDSERIEVPSINVTCEEEGTLQSPENIKCDNNQMMDIFADKNSLQNSKRRFSSIVFTHSDEIKILSDGESLYIASDKRERRASMSLFETCKLACPELNQNLGNSTEHLNQMILQNNENQGKLYFMLSQNEDNKGILEVVIIKVTNIVDKKQKEYQLQMDLIKSDEVVVYNNETSIRSCIGEVVNFDESFNIDVEEKVSGEKEDYFFIVFTLGNPDPKKVGKCNKIGEIRFDLMELIEGHVLKFNGREQLVICRNITALANKVKSKENSGKSLIFLRFSKASPLNLVIGIVELKDLKSAKPFNSVNVRISLATGEKVLESRRSKVIKKKYQNTEGVLKVDESFEFNMSSHKIYSKELIKSQINCNSENVFITIFICGRNNIGFSHVLGKCVIGPIEFADGTGLFHWNKAICNVGEIIYHWHTLKN